MTQSATNRKTLLVVNLIIITVSRATSDYYTKKFFAAPKVMKILNTFFRKIIVAIPSLFV